tara:strand:+ start:596 stop:823 length:228 start_codon:yes stop_codon:yes gene_type:complete
MKVGDLVRRKWTDEWLSFAAHRRAKHLGIEPNVVGVILEVVTLACDKEDYTQFLVQFAGEKKPIEILAKDLELVE